MQKPLHEKQTLLLTAAAGAGMMLALYLLLHIYPFGDATVLTGDLNGQYINYFAHFRAAFLEGSGFSYGLDKSLGGSMLGILAYYCASPLNFVYLLVDPVYYDLLAALLLAVKIVLACVFMAFFLGRRFIKLRHRAILPALCYGFCGYAIVYAQNIMWHDVLLLLPLICYGIDKLIITKRPFIYAAALGLAIFSDFYIAYMACIFSVLYFGYGLISGLPERQKKSWCAARVAAFAGGSLAAGALSAVMTLPAYADISASKGLGSGFSLSFATEFSFADFFRRLAPGSFNWKEDIAFGLPNVYAGLLLVVLTVIFFAANGVSLRQKLVCGGMLAVLTASLYFTDFMLMWHAFVPPVWFPYRHSFIFVFWLSFLGGAALEKGALTAKRLVGAAAVLAVFLAAVWPQSVGMYTPKRFLFTAGCLALFLAADFVLQRCAVRKIRAVVFGCLALLCAGELVLNSVWSMRQFEGYSHREYRQFTADGRAAVKAVGRMDDGIYRMEKTSWRSLNDDMLLGYRGITHFGSTQDTNATETVFALGYNEGTAAMYGAGGTLFADSFLGIRYLLADPNTAVPAGYVELAVDTGSELAVYQNPFALPLCFAVPAAAQDFEIAEYKDKATGSYDTARLQNDLMRLLSNGAYTDAADQTMLGGLCGVLWQSAPTLSGSLSSLTASFAQPTGKPQTVLFTVPYDENLIITADGQPVQKVRLLGTLCGAQLPAGVKDVTLSYKTPMLTQGVLLTLFGALALLAWWLIWNKKEKQVCLYSSSPKRA